MKQSTHTVEEFYKMVGSFQLLEALDQYYDEEVISWDNNGNPIKGLAELRSATMKFMENVKDAKITLEKSVIVNEFSLAHWHYQFSHEQMGRLDYDQISIGYWEGNKIVKEHHLYQLDVKLKN